nr:unnamed protein product [Digitaria exilis]
MTGCAPCNEMLLRVFSHCVAQRPSTSRRYLDVGIDLAGFFLAFDSFDWDASARRPSPGSSWPPPIGTPPSTSSIPMHVIHPAPVTTVFVLRFPSMEGYRSIASLGCTGATRGLLRRCIFTAVDYVIDLRLRLRHSSPSSSSTTAALLGSFGLHNLVASVAVSSTPFVYSNNCGLHRHLLPHRSSAPATVLETFSAGLSDEGAWLCTLPHTSGIGNTDVRGPGKPVGVSPDGPKCVDFGIVPPLRLPRRVAIFVFGRLLVRPRLRMKVLYVYHGYSTHGILDHGYSPSSSATSTSARRAIIRMSYSPVLSSRSIRITPTFCLRGDVSPPAPAFGFFSSLTVCGAPAKGEILAMKRLCFLGNDLGATTDVDNARKEYERFFKETLDVKNFSALGDLFPAARGLTDKELMEAVRHTGTLLQGI